MGTMRSLRRKLNADKVFIAEQVAQKRVEIVKKFVEERVKTDAEFAADVLKAVGENLPENIRKLAEETVKNGKTEAAVKRWENTGIFDRAETDPLLMTPIVESQARELLTDGTLSKLADDVVRGKLQKNPMINSGRIYPPENY